MLLKLEAHVSLYRSPELNTPIAKRVHDELFTDELPSWEQIRVIRYM